jgi:alpha-glucosidase (family GH31 glycosyl hydrolase)
MNLFLLRHAVTPVLVLCLAQVVFADVKRHSFSTPSSHLLVEILDDDMVHFEFSAGGGLPALDESIYSSPMIDKTDYEGPTTFSATDNQLETSDIRIKVDPANLCIRIDDKRRGSSRLATICPDNLTEPRKRISIDPASTQHVYGLGQQFKILGSADGDWSALGVREGEGLLGNGFAGFQEAAVGNVQIPVMYASGGDGLNYALFLDNVYYQRWDFNAFWWRVSMFGDQVRFYVMTGPDLLDLRADYMELTGRPPVPPKKAFGLWVSEFGYDNFGEIDTLLHGLRRDGFPVDGFVLDLNWFGGVVPVDDGDQAAVLDEKTRKSHMGRLNWDEDQADTLRNNHYSFANPEQKIKSYRDDDVALAAIEESYLAKYTDTFSQMPAPLSTYRRTNNVCDPAHQALSSESIRGFWGIGRMIDWSDPQAGAWIHENRRFPNLTRKGVFVHWTDLGEPEKFDPAACYEGVERTTTALKNEHPDIHNLYNLLWNKSIWDGYVAKQDEPNQVGITRPRPFILTRSGAGGTQRYGAAMWSGDIAGNLESLATHLNAQMHMSFSGIDYYGADTGGFRREKLPYNNKKGIYRGYEEETYTQWLANAAWFDVPVRPHTDNEFVQVNPPYATSPNLVGKRQSNLANIRQRYELIPYYYSLAYRAYLYGEPVIPPLVFHYQNDPNIGRIGSEKLIGRDMLVAAVAKPGEYARDVYLPKGTWVNYHTNEWLVSKGETIKDVPVYREGVFRLPVFVRAGTILPLMHVDAQTKDVFGHRKDSSVHDELLVKAISNPALSSFTLYEDDGETIRYDNKGRPLYDYRITKITQHGDDTTATVSIEPGTNVAGTAVAGAVNRRANVVKLVVDDAEATDVKLNGTALPKYPDEPAFNAAASGWFNAGHHLIVAKSEPVDVDIAKMFQFALHPITPRTTSVHFVCDNGVTTPGESVYVVGSLPQLGGPAWDTSRAVKLDPNIYYEYIWNPPPSHNGPGPSAPVWTGVVHGLPANTSFEWKCLAKRDDGAGTPRWESGNNNIFSTSASGYAGQAYGSF